MTHKAEHVLGANKDDEGREQPLGYWKSMCAHAQDDVDEADEGNGTDERMHDLHPTHRTGEPDKKGDVSHVENCV